jgi:hypothetical protein
MYAKIYSSMFDGTLATVGPWEAIVTFQQMLILCEPDGTIDMTAEVLSRRTTIPLDIILTGISALLRPDEKSRTPDEDGRRIIALHPERDWGWKIVNYGKYRSFKTPEEKREYMREYMREYRKSGKSGKSGKPELGKVTHADADADADADAEKLNTPLSATPTAPGRSTGNSDDVQTVFGHWRTEWGHPQAKLDEKRRKLIRLRLRDYSAGDLCRAITGYRNSPHHTGQNDRATVYDDIGLLLRDSAHVDAGLRFAASPPRTDLSKLSRSNVAAVADWMPPEMREANRAAN